MNGFKVYIAGPYTSGDKSDNTLAAIEAGDRLFRLGYAPYIPHLSHFWDAVYEHEYDVWLDLCLEWVKVCDAILRLPGESPGADVECELAYGIDIPVFHSVEQLHEAFTEKL